MMTNVTFTYPTKDRQLEELKTCSSPLTNLMEEFLDDKKTEKAHVKMNAQSRKLVVVY